MIKSNLFTEKKTEQSRVLEAKYGKVNEKQRDIFYMRILKFIPHLITEMTFGIYTYTDTHRREKAGNQN